MRRPTCAASKRYGSLRLQRAIGLEPRVAEPLAERRAEEFADLVDAVDVDLGHLLGDVGLGWQRQRLGDELMVQGGLVESVCERVDQPVVQAQRPPGAVLGNQSEHQLQGIALARFPAHEGIGVVRHEKAPVGVLGVALENDRRREAAQQGRHRSLWHVGKREALLGLAQLQDARGAGSGVLALEPQRQRRAGGVQQAERKGNVQGLLVRLARRWRSGLRDRESIGASARVVAAAHPEPGRARLGVPATELRQIPAGGRLHGGDEVLAGDRLAVVALEVDLHAALERRLAEERMQHADHLGALLVHRGRVEVVDLEIAVGADRMGERPCILQELRGAQAAHVRDALDRARV